MTMDTATERTDPIGTLILITPAIKAPGLRGPMFFTRASVDALKAAR